MHKFNFAKITALVLALIFTVSAGSGLFGVRVFADDAGDDPKKERIHEGKQNLSEDIDYWNEINIDESFAYQIRMAVNYGNRMAAQNADLGEGDGGGGYNGALIMNNIAPFWGFSEGEIETDKLNSPALVRGELLSESSVKYSRQLLAESDNAGFNGKHNAASAYAGYGLVLNLMGYDSVGSDAVDVQRQAFGKTTLASYYLASFVNVMFDMMFNVLVDTNPFQFFKAANNITVGKDVLDGIDYSQKATDPMTKLGQFFSGLYDTFVDFSWSVTVPLALIFIIIAFFLTKSGRTNVGSNIKKFCIRVVFLVMGIPILASAYTDTLDALKDTHASCDDYMTQAVSSTYLDFGAWVEQSRLDPSAASYGGHSGSKRYFYLAGISALNDSYIIANQWFYLRKTCSSINQANKVFDFGSGATAVPEYLKTSDTGALIKDTSTGTMSIDADGSTGVSASNRKNVLTVLQKYINGEKYTAADFQSGTIASLQGVDNYGDMLALSCDKYSFSQYAERKVQGLQGESSYYSKKNPENTKTYAEVANDRFSGSGFSDWSGYDLWNNGSMKGAIANGDLNSNPVYKYEEGTGSTSTASLEIPAGLDAKQKTGLSSMAMYTYLTTEFDQSGIIAYNGAPSVYTQKSHYAVNLIGGNYIMQFVFASNTIALLLGYFILALVYVFRAIFDIIVKGFHLMGHALLAAVGFYKSIGTTICMVINMIAQLFVCVIFFSFIADLMFTINEIVDAFVLDLGTSVLGLTSTSASSGDFSPDTAFKAELMVMISTVVSSFVIVFFVSFATKWRAAIMVAINSMTEELIGTLLGVQLSGASDGFMGGAALSSLNDAVNITKGAAAAGLGVAAVDAISDVATGNINGSSGSGASSDDEGNPFKEVKGEDITAADASVNPSTGAAFDGGKGAAENGDAATRAEAEELLANGFSGEVDSTKDLSGYYYGGTADGVVEAKDKAKAEAVKLEKERKAASAGSDSDVSDADEDAKMVYDEDGTPVVLRKKSKADYMKEQEEAHEAAVAASNGETASDGGETSDADSGETTADGNGGASYAANNKGKSAGGHSRSTSDKSAKNNENKAESSVESTEDGDVYTTTDPETGTVTKATQDPERGLVLSTEYADGAVSDVAISENGVNAATTDAEGNKSVSEITNEGVTSEYSGVDGSTESITADGTNTTVTRTDASGNEENITLDNNGNVVSSIEKTADGSTREVSTDENGDVVITEHNAATGYESVETVTADGSVKTESLGDTVTTTETDAAGNVVKQQSITTDENGNEVTTGYSVNSDNSVTETVTANGVTTATTVTEDGNKTVETSSVRADGATVTTTAEYGTDNIADTTTEVVTSANGDVLQSSVVTTGSDSVGDYTSRTVTTADAVTETKDYGNNHTVTTETSGDVTTTSETLDGVNYTVTSENAATGVKSVANVSANSGDVKTYDASGAMIRQDVITQGGNGNFTIEEHDSVTGLDTTTTLDSNGNGSSVVRSGSQIVSSRDVSGGYVTESGSGMTVDETTGNAAAVFATGAATGAAVAGSIMFTARGSGSDAESVVTQSYVSGATQVNAVNTSDGNSRTVYSDAVGATTSVSYNAGTGDNVTEFVSAGGDSGKIVENAAQNTYQRSISLAGGGYDNYTRTGSGSAMTENVQMMNQAGGTIESVSVGGQVQSMTTSTPGAGSYSMHREGENVISHQVEMSGNTVDTVTSSNGDVVKETASFTGAAARSENKGGVVSYVGTSLTGIDTSAYNNGSTSSETVQFAGMTMTNAVDPQTGNTVQTFVPADGLSVSYGNGSNGGKISINTPDGATGSYTVNTNGDPVVEVVGNPNGSGLVGTMGSNGTFDYVYTDSNGNYVDKPEGADAYNVLYADAVSNYANGVPNAHITMPSVSADNNFGSVPTPDAEVSQGAVRTPKTISNSYFERLFAQNTQIEENEEVPATERRAVKADNKNAPERNARSTQNKPRGSFGEDRYRVSGSASETK